MLYQTKSKELITSFFVESLGQDELEWLNDKAFYGDKVRVDTRARLHRDTGDSHRMTIYRPNELVQGISVGCRLIKKSHQGTSLYKLVLIPGPKQDFSGTGRATFWEILMQTAEYCHGWAF